MLNAVRHALLATVALTSFTRATRAQQNLDTVRVSPPPSHRTGWVAVNVGGTLAGPGSDPLSALVVDLQLQRNHAWYGLRGTLMLLDFESNESVGEVAFLYGRATRGTSSQAAIGAGLAVIDVCDASCHTTIGLPLTARGAVRPLSFLGLGVQLMGNLNSVEPIVALTLFLELGKLR
jgi:hypothetical protein